MNTKEQIIDAMTKLNREIYPCRITHMEKHEWTENTDTIIIFLEAILSPDRRTEAGSWSLEIAIKNNHLPREVKGFFVTDRQEREYAKAKLFKNRKAKKLGTLTTVPVETVEDIVRIVRENARSRTLHGGFFVKDYSVFSQGQPVHVIGQARKPPSWRMGKCSTSQMKCLSCFLREKMRKNISAFLKEARGRRSSSERGGHPMQSFSEEAGVGVCHFRKRRGSEGGRSGIQGAELSWFCFVS